MSAVNGDKSRFHRKRKQKIARRERTRELLKDSKVLRSSPGAPNRTGREEVSA